ncbi:uncharacterized protein FA14DRAFT_4935, partial [Meira miltonrushii]
MSEIEENLNIKKSHRVEMISDMSPLVTYWPFDTSTKAFSLFTTTTATKILAHLMFQIFFCLLGVIIISIFHSWPLCSSSMCVSSAYFRNLRVNGTMNMISKFTTSFNCFCLTFTNGFIRMRRFISSRCETHKDGKEDDQVFAEKHIVSFGRVIVCSNFGFR